jgi:putative ABC transport system permease protein
VNLLASVRTGLGELLAHKLRSVLTMLGVIFGIASVIAMVSIGAGAREQTLEQIRLMGTNVIQVNRRAVTGDLSREAQKRSPYGLTYGDAFALRDLCTFARLVVPTCRVFADFKVSGREVTAKVYGTTPEYLRAMRLRVAPGGRFLSQADLDRRAAICVLGADVKRAAFPTDDPVGRFIMLGTESYRIVGVMADRPAGGERGGFVLGDLNRDVYVPITSAIEDFQIYTEQPVQVDYNALTDLVRRMMHRPTMDQRSITQIVMQVESERQTVEAARVVRGVLNRRHGGMPDYEVAIPAELIRQSQRTQRVFNIVMGAIASISLIVGGIGIMNIMLATVTQRAREIGIRRCVGATRGDIIRQFLLETLVITSIGGLLGIALGVAMADLISRYAEWQTIVQSQAVVLALAVSVATGLVFGLHPAIRAASIQPVEALRAE